MKSLVVFTLILLFLHQINGQNSDEDKDDESEDEAEEEEVDSANDESDSEESTTTTTSTTTAKTKATKSPKLTTTTEITTTETTTTETTTTETTTTPKPTMSTTKRPKSAKTSKPTTTTTVRTTTPEEEEDDEENQNNSNGIEREEVDDNGDEDEEEGEEDNENDYFEDLSREDLLKNLIQSYATSTTNISVNNNNESINQKWIDLLTLFDKEIVSLVRAITPAALDAFYELDISSSCSNSLLRIATGLQQSQEWALKMLDSGGRFPMGLMSGTLSSLGAYDQCMDTKAIEEGTEVFRGQYCILQVRPPLPQIKGRISYNKPLISLNGSKFENTWLDKRIAGRWATGFYSVHIYNALCLPSTCSKNELNYIIRKYIGDYFEADVHYCDQKVDQNILRQMNTSQRIALIIVCISLIVVIIGSLIELCNPEFIKFRSFGRIISCFSIITNIRKLFTIDKQKMDQSLQFAHGLRVITMIWIIMIHTFTVGTLFVPMLVYRFEEEARKFGKQLSTQFIFNGYISVSNFFFLSGLVVTYITLPVMAKNGGPSLFKYVSIRWLRFIPPLIGTICFHLLWPLLGSGPIFKQMATQLTEPCVKNWWTNILLINNWLLLPDMCMVHTWFLSADFQLHIISFFVLFTLSRKKTLGLILIFALIMAGIAIPALMVLKTGGPPMPMPFEEPKLDQFYKDLNVQYHPTYNHLSTYFIGVLVGFILTQNKDELKLSIHWKLISWTILPILTFLSVFATYLWTGLELEYSRLTASAYSGLHRFVYILFIAWIAIHCSTTNKSIVTRILSSKFFVPLSRLSFTVYLTHILIVWYFVLRSRELIRFTFVDFIHSTGGIILYSLFFALVLHLLFESVWTNLINLMIKKPTQQQLSNGVDKQQFNGNTSELSINRHFMNGALRGQKWSPNGDHQDFNSNYDFSGVSVPGNIYVEVGEAGHLNECYDGCHCIKNTQL